MTFVKKHALHGIQITDVRHTETWNLPLTAIREAIINAVVHANYAQKGAPIRLAIFDDRIEIENPGLLLFADVTQAPLATCRVPRSSPGKASCKFTFVALNSSMEYVKLNPMLRIDSPARVEVTKHAAINSDLRR